MKSAATSSHDTELQSTSWEIWDQKYRLKNAQGAAVDTDITDTYRRVAQALAAQELPERRTDYYTQFLWALEEGAVPAGRIMANLGAGAHKPATSTINCTVAGTVGDSMQAILQALTEAGLTLKAGCGIGYEFSTLRPRGARVAGAGASTSGPLSFMDVFDRLCFTISSAGGRRGAQMATLDISHPDVEDFIRAKRENGRLRQFNLSLLITDDFMQAVQQDAEWPLHFPLTHRECADEQLDIHNAVQVLWRYMPHLETNTDYIRDEEGRLANKIYRRVRARELWDLVMQSNYDFAEPGFILIDRVNRDNNLWFCENIRATNPCGEQPLTPYGACLLGSINLTRCVEKAFTDKARFHWEKFSRLVAIFTRMLDNVVELHGLALPHQAAELLHKRRHGMGFFGLASALAMLRIPYGSDVAVAFTERVSQTLALEGWRQSLQLAKEKGPAPVMLEEFTLTPRHLAQCPQLYTDGFKVGDRLPGRTLLVKYSAHLRKLAQCDAALVAELEAVGPRFSHHSSIAPTGTIALSFGNNASNGIEPSFSHHYTRNVICAGKKTKRAVDVYSYEYWLYRQLHPNASVEDLPDYFVDSTGLTAQQHIAMQAAAQRWVDAAISKTINVASDCPFDDFAAIYLHAWEQGLKGCTTFRFNPEAFQGVLVDKSQLQQQLYVFTLADGSEITARGDDDIVYDGETHSAANLYDAMKEGYYGKIT